MGLQVRLRHAQGERSYDLAERSLDNPLMVGKSPKANVVVSAPGVTDEHCVLFVHEGRWVVHDNSGGTSWLNGKPLKRPTKLRIGDTITIGAEGPTAATLLIDPEAAAQGRTGQPAGIAPATTAAPIPKPAAPRAPASPAQVAPPASLKPAPPPKPRPAPSDKVEAVREKNPTVAPPAQSPKIPPPAPKPPAAPPTMAKPLAPVVPPAPVPAPPIIASPPPIPAPPNIATPPPVQAPPSIVPPPAMPSFPVAAPPAVPFAPPAPDRFAGMVSLTAPLAAEPEPVAAAPIPAAAAPTGEDPFGGWRPDAGASTTLTRRKSRSQLSFGGVLSGLVLTVGIITAAVYYVRHPIRRAAPVVASSSGQAGLANTPLTGSTAAGQAPSAPSPATAPATGPAMQPDASVTVPPAPPHVVESPKTAPPPVTQPAVAVADANDPHKGDPTWSEIEDASISASEGLAIMKFDDYRRLHPNAFSNELDAFTAQALDRLWWKRIEQLCNKRDRLSQKAPPVASTDPKIPSLLAEAAQEDDKKQQDKQVAEVQTILTRDMGYSSPEIPDLANEDQIAKLRAQRDGSKFGAWKISLLKYIRLHHGSTPWDGEN